MVSVACDMSESPRQAVVTLTASDAAAAINEGYQTADRAGSYVATQDLVVPKETLFGKIIEVLMRETAPSRRSIRILEPGMGPAAFTRFVLRRPFLDRFDDIRVQGADISHGMLAYAQEVIHTLCQSNLAGQQVTIACTPASIASMPGIRSMVRSDPRASDSTPWSRPSSSTIAPTARRAP